MSLNIAILTHHRNTHLYQRLSDTCAHHNHHIHLIQTAYCYMNVSAKDPLVYSHNHKLFKDLDAIIPQFKPAHTFYGTAVLRQFEMLGIYTLNASAAILCSRDKLRALQLLATKDLPSPITGFADSPAETEKLIEMVGGTPLIIRLLEGTAGRSTVLAETQQAAVSVINAFKQLKANILVQEYIAEAGGSDIRCMVVGHQVVGAIQRQSLEFGFRHNRRPMQSAVPIKITALEKKMVLRAAKVMKLNLASIDFVRSKRGPLILSVNCSPNLELFEKLSGFDVITPIIQFLEKNAQK